MKLVKFILISFVFLIALNVNIIVSSAKLNSSFDEANVQGVSRNWSGYVASNNGTYTGVSGSWIVPTVKSDIYGADAAWVGIGGVSSTDLIQAGTQSLVDSNGEVTYQAFYEVLPQASQVVNLPVKDGDLISVSLEKQDKNNWLITLKNNTTGKSVVINQVYNSSLSSAEWIEEAPSGYRRIIPLSDFGNVKFENGFAIKDGKKLSISEANAQPVVMANSMGEPLVNISEIGNNGSSFNAIRTSNSSNSSPRRIIRIYLQD